MQDWAVGSAWHFRIALYETTEHPTMAKYACLALCLATLASPTFAEGNRILKALDQNGDGAISREEVLTLRADIFARIDADSSGTVTQTEIAAAEAAAQERRQALRAGDV
jgi:hypothetical protein